MGNKLNTNMFKTVLLSTALVATQAAVTGDFFSGFQTGVFLGDFDGFEDYNCPLPELSDMAKNMIGMSNKPAKKGSKKSKKPKHEDEDENGMGAMVDKFDQYVDQFGILASVMDEEY